MYTPHFFYRNFVPLVILILATIIAGLLFIDVSKISAKTLSKTRNDPFVLCTEGTTTIQGKNNSTVTLEAQKRKNIEPEDFVKTAMKSSATIFWADGSVTRMGENTEIVINELRITTNNATKVDISMNSGKAWTNTSRILDEDSSFLIRYENGSRVAAVRGTVFDINLEKGYVSTESHAIEIYNEKGERVTSVPAGQTIAVSDAEKVLTKTEGDDIPWKKLNFNADSTLENERIEQIKNEILLIQNNSQYKKFQNILRSLLGLKTFDSPYVVNISASGVTLSFDPSRLQEDDVKNLGILYEKFTGLNSKYDTILSKELIQETILQLAPEKDRKKYSAIFAKTSLYDSWKAAESMLPEDYKKLRENIDRFSKIAGNTEEIQRIEAKLPEITRKNLDTLLEKIQQLPQPKSLLDAGKSLLNGAVENTGNSIQNTAGLIIDAGKISGDGVENVIQSLSK